MPLPVLSPLSLSRTARQFPRLCPVSFSRRQSGRSARRCQPACCTAGAASCRDCFCGFPNPALALRHRLWHLRDHRRHPRAGHSINRSGYSPARKTALQRRRDSGCRFSVGRRGLFAALQLSARHAHRAAARRRIAGASFSSGYLTRPAHRRSAGLDVQSRSSPPDTVAHSARLQASATSNTGSGSCKASSRSRSLSRSVRRSRLENTRPS